MDWAVGLRKYHHAPNATTTTRTSIAEIVMRRFLLLIRDFVFVIIFVLNINAYTINYTANIRLWQVSHS